MNYEDVIDRVNYEDVIIGCHRSLMRVDSEWSLKYTRAVFPCSYHHQQNKCYPPIGGYLPISKLDSILAVANLLAHNNISQICYCGQISLQSAAVNCSFSDNLTPFWGSIYFAGDGA